MNALTLALLFSTASQTFNLPSNLLASVCFIESSHKIDAVHEHDGVGNSVGICQIKLNTAAWLGYKGNEKDLMKPSVNIYWAAKYLKYQLKRYHGNVSKALIGYNKGNAKGLDKTEYSEKVITQWRMVRYEFPIGR